ncbi:DUF4145 domain-containing protein [Klebsiella michiganensis]|uniref:DUF4145 domain-containing protein n=1 Tax=Klebsiella michiganensis TaxID=1134687 RepID=UPI0022715600|nr:DUF4145 domain-containing protein [Klebsiella michiganensis]ELT9742706.1 DUF4145 domain-containing protein [Klebsiella michiganensis]MCY0834200.1 DUF4145 domain-containing protein [Klebsiella michiganensis]MDD7826793.1 DUF4145 domain-containing protein [Klebsiella michiganensis]MDD7855716.1 DUF4145 domain-containing protein [Klebsiella michiganensis]
MEEGEENELLWYGEDNYYFSECKGCENITLYIESTYSGMGDDFVTTQFPPKIIRKEPKWLQQIDGKFIVIEPSAKIELFREIYIALKNNMPRLAIMGVRALLELVMIEKIGDQGSFIKNLRKLKEEGYISGYQYDAIEKVIDAGHASMHRGYKASNSEIFSIMDITENIIESIYINKLNLKKINPTPRVKKPK